MSKLNPREEKFASILAWPFEVLLVGAQMFEVARRKPKIAPVQSAVVVDEAPKAKVIVPTQDQQFCVSDKRCSRMYGNVKVCFYQYNKLRTIRCVARKGKVQKELYYTPKMAKDRDEPFELDSAIAYIRENGFKGIELCEPGSPVQNPNVEAASEMPAPVAEAAPAQEPSPAPAQQKPVKSKSMANALNERVEPLDRWAAPFQGVIRYAGDSERPGRNGEPPYTTFVVSLESEAGGRSKEFVGEHLAELVEQHGLAVGRVVKIQLVGRRRWEVIENGERKPRHRNEYSLEVIE